MKKLIGFLGALASFGVLAGSADENSGEVELKYQPISCFTAPCPQYLVLSINGTKVEGLSADVINFDPQSTSAASFKTFLVKGEWVKKDGYIEITAHSWHAIVGEKIKENSPPANLPKSKLPPPHQISQ